MKKSGIIYNRYFIIIIIFIISAAALIIRLYDMQIINGEDFARQSSHKVTHEFPIEAPRGIIYDRNGLALAYNRESNDIYLTKAYNSDDELNESLLQISYLFEKNEETFYHSFDQYVLADPVVFNPGTELTGILEWQMDRELLSIPEKDTKNSAKELILYLRDKFDISDDYDSDDAYRIICMRYEILKNRWNYITGGRMRIAEDVSLNTIAVLSEQRHIMQGVIIQKKMVREYGDVMDVAHVLGYVGNITGAELAELEKFGYDGKDIIGKTGIEEFAEKYLRGTDGYLKVEADERTGRIIERLEGYDEKNGNNVTLTIDMELQRIAMEAMKETIADIVNRYDGKINFGDASAGSTIVMDVQTGEVLVMASYPSYDPKWFIYNDEESQQNRMEAIFDSYGMPTFNRAIQGIYAPGSTFKPIVAIAALESEEHEYDSESEIQCDGIWTYDNWDFYCHLYIESKGSHGPLTISKAIETSCNLVFQQLGIEVGIDEIDEWVEKFGLGSKTGIDLYGEVIGIRSNREYKYKTFDEKWWSADTGQSSIGQLYSNFTPIQLVVYAAALANEGKKLTPYLIKEINSPSGANILKGKTEFEQIVWSEETYAVISEGMGNVTLDGTAKKVFHDYPILIAGKTGTAETGREAEESSNALFICYAPIENPQIAIVTVIENGVWGSYTASVAKKILNAYFDIEEGE